MRSARLLLAIGSLVTIAMGQWLGEKLSLLDPFGIPAGHQSLAYNNHNHSVYVAGDESDSLLVIDADRCKSIARVGVGGGVRALGYNPVENKLYCAHANADTVVVLDCTTKQVLARVPVGDSAGTFCYDSLDNKMYIGNWGSRSVTVIDCRADIAVATVESCGGAQGAPYGMCFVPAHRTVYVTSQGDSSVVAIDCFADTVLARIPVGQEPLSLCYNPTNDRVYCPCKGDTICGIDAATNRVASVISHGHGATLGCDPARNVLLVSADYGLAVVDCSADTVLAEFDSVEGTADLIAYDSMDDRIYMIYDSGGWGGPGIITVVDGESYGVQTRFWGFFGPQAVCLTNTRARVFVAGGGDDGIIAVDGIHGRPRRVWRDDGHPVGLYADSASGKLYCAVEDEYVELVCVIDPQRNSVLATLPLTGYPEVVAFNPVDHKVYLAGEDYLRDEGVITVIDAVGDTFLSNIALGPIPSYLAYDADDDLLFVPGPYGDYVLAIDGKTDRVVDSCRVSESPVGLMYNEAQHRVYSFGDHGEVTTFAPRAPRHSNYISLGAELRCFALDASGMELYYGCPNSESLHLFDCVAESLAGGIPLPLPPTGLSYDSQHDQVYCVYGKEHSGMSIIDCSKRLVRAIVEVDAQRLYWDSGADDVYCLTDTSVTVVDGETRRVTATLETGLTIGAASVPGGPRVYVADCYESYLTVVRTDEWPRVRAAADVQATVVRGRLDWTGTLAVMYDKSGRRVADVHRGGNDVSRLQPGVYFVRQNGVRPGTYARKVVITG